MSGHFRTNVSEIWIDDESIMHIVFAAGVELKLADMKEGYAIFRRLGIGPGQRKSKQLLSGGHFTISKEAREFAARTGKDYFIAAAMVTESNLMRLVINTFNALHKHEVPFKLFATEKEALAWLRSFS